jgi:hypothetical protein
MVRVDGAWKPAEAVWDPRGPIWPSATSIQGFLPELRRFQAGAGVQELVLTSIGIAANKADVAAEPTDAVVEPADAVAEVQSC